MAISEEQHMTLLLPEEFWTRSIDLSPFVVIADMTPPRDPDEDNDDDDDEGDDDDEEPVVREPDDR